MKILMIGAHQDDNEINCGGLAVKLVERGHEVRFLSMSNGCGGHHILSREETVATRAKESASASTPTTPSRVSSSTIKQETAGRNKHGKRIH